MNIKIISLVTLTAIAAAGQAQIILTQNSAPNGAGSVFGNGTFATSYTVNKGTVTVNKTAHNAPGAVSGWVFTALDHTAGQSIDTLILTDTFSPGSVGATSQVIYTVEADEQAAATFKGPTFLSGGGPTATFLHVLTQPGWNPITNSLTFTFNVAAAHLNLYKFTINQDFKNVIVNTNVATVVPEPAPIAVLGFGIAALFARRRRKNG